MKRLELGFQRFSRALSNPDVVFVLGWAALLAFLMSQHTPWRDEFQAWLVATRTGSWGEFFEAVRYERAPPLHYLLLRGIFGISSLLHGLGLEKDPARPFYFQIVTYFFSVAAVAIVVLRSGLPRWIRYLVPFSIFLLLDYGVISRNYPIGVALVLLSATLFKESKWGWAWICLGVASLVQFFFLPFGFVFLGIQIWEMIRAKRFNEIKKRRALLELATCFLLMALAAWSQRPPVDSPFPTAMHVSWHIGTSIVHQLAWGLTGLSDLSRDFVWNSNGFDRFANAPVIGFLCVPALALFFGFPLHYFLLLVAFPLVFIATTYVPAARYAGFVFLAWLVCLILRRERIRTGAYAITAALLILSAATSVSWLRTWSPFSSTPNYDFSGSGEMKLALGNTLSNPRVLVVMESEELSFPMTALTGQPVFIVGRESFLDRPDCRVLDHPKTLVQWCESEARSFQAKYADREIYLALPANLTPPSQCGATTQVFKNSRPVMMDGYSVYLWGPQWGKPKV